MSLNRLIKITSLGFTETILFEQTWKARLSIQQLRIHFATHNSLNTAVAVVCLTMWCTKGTIQSYMV